MVLSRYESFDVLLPLIFLAQRRVTSDGTESDTDDTKGDASAKDKQRRLAIVSFIVAIMNDALAFQYALRSGVSRPASSSFNKPAPISCIIFISMNKLKFCIILWMSSFCRDKTSLHFCPEMQPLCSLIILQATSFTASVTLTFLDPTRSYFLLLFAAFVMCPLQFSNLRLFSKNS